MKKIKLILVLLLIAVAVVATIPWWGNCDLNARYCSTLCNLKNMDSDMKAAGCRTRCAMKNAGCKSDEAAKGLNDFIKGLNEE